MPGTLEYEEEEDLFADSDGNINTATPIAGPSRPRLLNPSPGYDAARIRPPPVACPADHLPILKSSVGLSKFRPRLVELKELREVKSPEVPKIGPISLKQQCMAGKSTSFWSL